MPNIQDNIGAVGGILSRLFGGGSYEPEINYDPNNIMYLSQLNAQRQEQGMSPVDSGYYMDTYLPTTMRPPSLYGRQFGGTQEQQQSLPVMGAIRGGAELDYIQRNPYMYSAMFEGGQPLEQLTPSQNTYMSNLASRYR